MTLPADRPDFPRCFARVLIKFALGATGNEAESIKRSMTSRNHGSKLPESQQNYGIRQDILKEKHPRGLLAKN